MIRGGRGVASRCPSGSGATREADSRTLLAIDDLLFELDCLLLNLRHRPRQRHVHVGVCVFRRQRVVAPVDYNLSDLAVLFNVDDYVSA